MSAQSAAAPLVRGSSVKEILCALNRNAGTKDSAQGAPLRKPLMKLKSSLALPNTNGGTESTTNTNLQTRLAAATDIEELEAVCDDMFKIPGFFHPSNHDGTTIRALPNSYRKDAKLNVLVFQALCENVKLLWKQLNAQKQTSAQTPSDPAGQIRQWSDLSHLLVCRFESNQNKNRADNFSSHHQALKDHASGGYPDIPTKTLSEYMLTLSMLKTAKLITEDCPTWRKLIINKALNSKLQQS